MSSKNFLALDVGSRRIGLAMADSQVKIAVPFGWLENNENIVQEITELVLRHDINTIVVGYPRINLVNQQSRRNLWKNLLSNLKILSLIRRLFFKTNL